MASLSAEVKLIAPSGYVSGAPFTVRVEVRDNSGARDWNLWNAEAILASDNTGVTLSANRILLRNGLGTVLLTLTGSADFTLTATVNGARATRPVRNLGGQPSQSVSGVLSGGSTTWSGLVRITGDLTVPTGHTLTLQPDTMVLVNGVASGTGGIRINVNGSIQALGTELQPVTITCADPNLNWGQIRHDNAQPSSYEYAFISKAGRAPGEGHTGAGPAIRPSNSSITFEHCVISDLTAGAGTVGKIMQASGSTLTLRDCVLARARMGPEIAGTGLICTDSYLVEMNGPDDADGIYLHSAGGRSLTLSGCVIAAGDDDAVDTLDSNVSLEKCIIRDWLNPNEDAKGVSVFHGEVSLKRCLIVNCFAGVSAKSGGPLAVVRMDHCTVSALDKGVSAATKSNATAGNINFHITNSIVRAVDAVHSDFGPDKFVSVTYCNLSEVWPGVGNITADPFFVNAVSGDYHLQPGSPAIDAGDPAAPSDADGSRTDLGYFSTQSSAGRFYVSLTSPASGALFVAPTNIVVNAMASASTGTVARVQFYEGSTRLGEDSTSPYGMTWSVLRPGTYTLNAVAIQASGVMATSAPVTISVTSGEGPSTNILVAAASDWKFLDDGSDQGAAWTRLNFDDTSWKSGKAQLGYGDGDEATILGFGPTANNKFVTYYFRRTFVVDDPSRVRSLTLDLLRDDGAIVYLNGQEIRRVGMPVGAVDFRTYASTASEYNWESAPLAPALPIAGTNVLAVEVHQGNASSSDLSFDLGLAAVLSAPANARPVAAITSPADHTTFAALASFPITANALDVDGKVVSVEFYANGVKLGEDTSSPYSFAWASVPAGEYALTVTATDASGLSGTSGVVNVSVSADTGPPNISRQLPAPGAVTELTEITVHFTKEVAGVEAGDLLINGVPAREVRGSGSEYVFSFTQPSPGPVVVGWASTHGITDTFTPPSFFNSGASGATWQYEFLDRTPPRLQIALPEPRSTVSGLTNIVVTFNEVVMGVDISDLSINSVRATGLSGSGAGPYSFSFSQPAQGTVAVNWSETHGIRDEANNPFGGGAWTFLLDTNQTAVVINEIMYHPDSENTLEEYIELNNRSGAPISLKDWRISDGVQFSFPDVMIPANGFLVIAADLGAFRKKYPGVANVVGNWTGILSNSREDIDLDDARGNRVDSVRYADEGDWAVRQRGPLDRGHRGWVWLAEHDGLGKSLELINPNSSNATGQNWASSVVPQGTPGRANSVLKTEIAPLIQNVRHFPIVPKSTESVRVTVEVNDESGRDLTVTLNYRGDQATPPPFIAVPLRDDGLNGDASAGDGVFTAILPAQANNTVVEFYVAASDALGNERTWPAPAIAASNGTGPTGQAANALYQVDDTSYGGSQPLYKIVMTESERAELAVIPSQSNAEGPNSQMNATFISIDGTGTEVRYLAGVRNRGHGTRTANPPNYRVNFREDEPWKGVVAINLNTRQVHTQHFGSWLANRSGGAGTYSQAVQVRVNNVNRADSGGGMFGSYAANEVYDSDWAARHVPLDSGGNLYKVVRDIRPPNFDYRGPTPNAYTNTYFKETNVSENDWDDLIAMLQVMGENSGTEFTAENVRRVINLEQWMTHLAVMNLMANGESGLNTGNNDDYYMYQGVEDRRSILLFHDLDQVLGQPGSLAQNVDVFRATCCPISGDSEGAWRAMVRFLRSPDFEPLYYATLQRLLDTSFSKPQFDVLLDQVLSSYVPQATITAMKSWMDGRRAFVQSQLPASVKRTPPIATIVGVPRSPGPQTLATLSPGGTDITHYRYSLNQGAFGAETPVATPIQLSALANGTNTVAVIARNSAGVWQPETNATTRMWIVNSSWPTVRLNEVLAANGTALNRSGSFPDAIELYNEGTLPVNLSGMRLSDDRANPNKYTFSIGATLAAGAYLVLDANQLGFALSQSGDGVFLFDRAANGGALLDSVTFGNQVEDLSIGRLNTSGEWMLTQPTFGLANLVQSLGDVQRVRINEWLASGVSPNPDDFVELYNPQPLPAALGGGFLTDQPISARARSQIAPLSFIPPNGYAVFTSGNGNRPSEFNFNLASEQGEIALVAPDFSLIDSVLYGPQRTGVSTGRCPDGAQAQIALVTPTPGGPNECPDVPVAPQTITLIPFSHVWKYDATGTDLGLAWKEIGYDDAAWRSGPGVLGFENSALAAPLLTSFGSAANPTYYFRTQFDFDGSFAGSTIQVTHLVDDGAAFYLNGVEIARYNLAAGAGYRSFASANQGDATPQTFIIPAGRLRAGPNYLAVEVHQINATSSDVVFGFKMDALVAASAAADSGVLINEVLANNATLGEADGSRPDWIELYNPTGVPVDLAGMSLTDDAANPRRWIFPNGSVLASKGFLTVRADSAFARSDANTGFGLSADGGAIFLFNRLADGGGLQSSVTYGLQAPDWSIGRVPDGSTNWVLNSPTLGRPNASVPLGSPTSLRINEWMADPSSGDDWFEVFNLNPAPVEISRLWLSDSLSNPMKHALPPLSFIGNGAHSYRKFIADENQEAGANHVNFKLSAGGESLAVAAPDGVLIDGVSFGPQITGVAQGRWPDGGANVMNFARSATPGAGNFLPLDNIVINELLTHTDPPLEDAVELFNPSGSPVDISGWFLSDTSANLRKYRLPANSVIPAGGYLVLYEYHFNRVGDPVNEPFSFSSARGDEVWLSQTRNGALTGYRAFANVGPAENSVSFGRFQTSQGLHFVPMARRTFGSDSPATTNEFRLGTGLANSSPKIGPVVISEIMYRPAGTNDALEFVELSNLSGATVPLYDPVNPTNTWRLRGGIDFEFPLGSSVPASGNLVVVSFDPRTDLTALSAFQSAYGSSAALIGPYRGRLSNSADAIELQKPDAPQTIPGPDLGLVPHIAVDRIDYASLPPWPTLASGTGYSLQKIDALLYGNDPVNWMAGPPNPGIGAPASDDKDNDGLPDSWELANGLNPNDPADAASDTDNDGLNNFQEYKAGTDPRSASSVLKGDLRLRSGGALVLEFTAAANRSYRIEFRDGFADVSWRKLSDIDAAPADRVLQWPIVPTESIRFLRIVVAP